jgi:hypothetical protein
VADRILVVCGQADARHAVAEAAASLAARVVDGHGDDPFTEPFDLAVLDGIALDRWWRRLAQRRAEEHPVFLPALVLSGRHGATVTSKAYEGAVDDVTTLPVDPVELRIRVTTLLRARQTSHELETRFRPLFDRVPAGLFRAVVRGDDLFALDANAGIAPLLTEDDRLAMRSDDARVLARRLRMSGIVRELRTTVRRPDGVCVTVLVAARVVQDGRDPIVEGALHVIGEQDAPRPVELLSRARRRRRARRQPLSPVPPSA